MKKAKAEDDKQIRRAAEAGDADAQFKLCLKYEKARGDWARREVFDWCRAAAEKGLAKAQFKLACIYEDRTGIAADWPEAYCDARALEWYEKAAAQGHRSARTRLRFKHDLWLAECGDATAQWRLAERFAEGVGVAKDPEQALRWYETAARFSDTETLFKLGMLYVNGTGIPKNEQRAVIWFEAAARRGHTEAQFTVAGMYASGRGVPKHEVHAYAWFSVAAAREHDAAREALAALESLMSPAKRGEAQDLAAKLFADLPSDS